MRETDLIQFHYEGIFVGNSGSAGRNAPASVHYPQIRGQKPLSDSLCKIRRFSGLHQQQVLHFTKELLEKIKEKGIKIAHVTLHVGLGTFRPVKVENILEHHMHSEFYRIEEEDAELINETKKNGGRVISVGTTSTRTLESVAEEDGTLHAKSGWTDIFIYPGYKFKVIDGLITNFHLPESTLLMLVSALAGREHILNAYNIAVKERYRFFSFGDAMFIHP